MRVSSEEQGWKYGPDGQNLTIDEAVSRTNLQESGPPFLDEQSAWRNSDERPALRSLLTAADAGLYKVLVVAYFSRWSRDAEVALRIRRELHAARRDQLEFSITTALRTRDPAPFSRRRPFASSGSAIETSRMTQ